MTNDICKAGHRSSTYSLTSSSLVQRSTSESLVDSERPKLCTEYVFHVNMRFYFVANRSLLDGVLSNLHIKLSCLFCHMSPLGCELVVAVSKFLDGVEGE